MSEQTPRRIFVSYRRDDTRHMAGRLYDRLAERFGDPNVFMDVDSIEPGVDFAQAIEDAIDRCDVLLALVGRDWLSETDEQGRRRLDDPDDLVVLEIGSALDLGILVIPVLIDGAAAPRRVDLPEQLTPLSRRNAARLDHDTFRTDIVPLLSALDRAPRRARPAAAAPHDKLAEPRHDTRAAPPRDDTPAPQDVDGRSVPTETNKPADDAAGPAAAEALGTVGNPEHAAPSSDDESTPAPDRPARRVPRAAPAPAPRRRTIIAVLAAIAGAILVVVLVTVIPSGRSPSAPATGVASGVNEAAAGGAAGTPASATANACAPGGLPTRTAGTLTIGTDQPAYQPWYVDDKPENGQGFESAVAYAIADQLGYPKDKVTWTRVPFNAAIQPGPKSFDLNLTEFSITDERKQAVDFSAPYYAVKQAVVTLSTSQYANAKDLAGLKGARLGAQVGTTSYDAIGATIAPSTPPAVFNTNDDAKLALSNGQVDAIVVDLPTAFFITGAELQNGKIVGQLPASGTPEQFGAVLDKGSALTGCVSQVVGKLRSAGTLTALEQQWLTTAGSAPELK